jgi:hypothetical protein
LDNSITQIEEEQTILAKGNQNNTQHRGWLTQPMSRTPSQQSAWPNADATPPTI